MGSYYDRCFCCNVLTDSLRLRFSSVKNIRIQCNKCRRHFLLEVNFSPSTEKLYGIKNLRMKQKLHFRRILWNKSDRIVIEEFSSLLNVSLRVYEFYTENWEYWELRTFLSCKLSAAWPGCFIWTELQELIRN